MPAQEPHVDSETWRPPRGGRPASPSRAIVSRIRWLPGKSDERDRRRARAGRAARRRPTHMSSHEPFVHEPTMTCSIGVPSTSPTGTTRSGRAGQRDERLERREVELDLVVVRRRRRPAASGRQSSSRPEAREVLARDLVRGEDAGGQRQLGAHVGDRRALGQRAGVADARARRTRRSCRCRPRTVSRRSSSRITSLAVTQGRSAPVSQRGRRAGIGKKYGPPPMAHRHVEAARADGQHARRAAERRVAVGAEQDLARAR